jgi:DNA topoisomerase-6 subunit B
VPFTSESKNAIADVPEILDEIENGVRAVASKMRKYLGRRDVLSKRKEKENLIRKVIPRLAIKVSDILDREPPNINPVVARIMGNLLVYRLIKQTEDGFDVEIRIKNHTSTAHSFKLHDFIPYEIKSAKPSPHKAVVGDRFDYLWEVSLRSGGDVCLRYTIGDGDNNNNSGEETLTLPEPVVEGVSAELVTGARAIA